MAREIQAHELAARLRAGEAIHLLDVRQPWEHELAKIAGTTQLVPLGELPARAEEVCPAAGAVVVTYCHHGVRSLRAALFLESAGHADVLSLAGGIEAWSSLVDPSVPRY